MNPVPDCSPPIAAIRALVAADAHIDVSSLVAHTRVRPVAYARQLGIALCRELTGALLVDIAHAFGLRDHSAAVWAVQAVANRRVTEPAYEVKWVDLLSKATHAISQPAAPDTRAAVNQASIILAALATGDLVSVRVRLAAKASGLGLHTEANASSTGRACDRAALVDSIITLSAAIARNQRD